MIDTNKLDEIARKLTGLMPASVEKFQGEIEKNMKAGLQGVLQKMDLVTREEYEIQTAVLARTREKLEALEARVDELGKT